MNKSSIPCEYYGSGPHRGFVPEAFELPDIPGMAIGAVSGAIGASVGLTSVALGGLSSAVIPEVGKIASSIKIPTVSVPEISLPDIGDLSSGIASGLGGISSALVSGVPTLAVASPVASALNVDEIKIPTLSLPNIGDISESLGFITSGALGELSSAQKSLSEWSYDVQDLAVESALGITGLDVEAIKSGKIPGMATGGEYGVSSSAFENLSKLSFLNPVTQMLSITDKATKSLSSGLESIFGTNAVSDALNWRSGALDVAANEAARISRGLATTPASLYDLGEDIVLKVKEASEGKQFGTYERSHTLLDWQEAFGVGTSAYGIDINEEYVPSLIRGSLSNEILDGVTLGDITATLYEVTADEPVLVLQPEIGAVDLLRSAPELADVGLLAAGATPRYMYVYQETDDSSLVGLCEIDGVIQQCP